MKKILIGFALSLISANLFAFDFQANYIKCFSPSAGVMVTVSTNSAGGLDAIYTGSRSHSINCATTQDSLTCQQPNGMMMNLSRDTMNIETHESIDRQIYEVATFYTNGNISHWICSNDPMAHVNN